MSPFVCSEEEGVTIAAFPQRPVTHRDTPHFADLAGKVPGDLVLDLTQVKSIEGGFGPVLQTYKVLRQRSLRLAVALPADLHEIWQIVKLDKVIPGFLDVDDAVQALASQADEPIIIMTS